ncbi:hypothetical protein MHL31_16115 [Lutibacter sp. A80]|uniref:hypothetical protein n=1 Tax=unclassified Lutibacter TaxID=2626258 RepID=UPI001F065A2B|nr:MULTISPECIES: hypothetical protein [unclassified Lutibacter]UMB53861.1 hypothetical protein MKD41_16230 [Lutibacter sp. A64]UMB60588.1 hypothetical protein MHL31_16115 [Lutibacter sp. A80]
MKKTSIFIFLLFSVLIHSQQKYSGEVFYNISLKTKKSKKSDVIKEPTRGEKISEKEYKKLLENYFPDFNKN